MHADNSGVVKDSEMISLKEIVPCMFASSGWMFSLEAELKPHRLDVLAS